MKKIKKTKIKNKKERKKKKIKSLILGRKSEKKYNKTTNQKRIFKIY